MHFSLARQQ